MRLLAVALSVGGGLGALLTLLGIGKGDVATAGDIVAAGLAMALYVAALLTGVSLWKRRAKAQMWSALIFAMQVPVVSARLFTYEWFTGAAVMLSKRGESWEWAMVLGAADEFRLASELVEPIFGINFFALLALMWLLWSRRSKRSTLPVTMQAG